MHVFENRGPGGGGVITFMLTCVTCTCYRLGWDVNVHVNLRHTHMLRHVGWVGGDVNVHVNLRHMHMLRHWFAGAMLTFMLTCGTCTCYVTSKNGGKLSVIKKIVNRGSKAEPLCTHCGRRGHNASSCESLG